MRITTIGLLLAAQLLYGQNTGAQSGDRVLYFANTDSLQGMQEIDHLLGPWRVLPPLCI